MLPIFAPDFVADAEDRIFVEELTEAPHLLQRLTLHLLHLWFNECLDLFYDLIVLFVNGRQCQVTTLGKVFTHQTEPRRSPVDRELLLDMFAMLLRFLPTVRADDLTVLLSACWMKADGVEIERRMAPAAVASFFILGYSRMWDELALANLPLLRLHISI